MKRGEVLQVIRYSPAVRSLTYRSKLHIPRALL
jgi:hypothetical protein